MTHKTKGIVLRTVKYGETSLIVTIFTETLGVQTYMVNGVRSTSKKNGKANCFQPSAILDLVVYHNEQKNMQRIQEVQWAYVAQHSFGDVIKNCIALFMVELIYKCLKQPEQHIALYNFFEDILIALDKANRLTTANLPLFFSVHLTHFLGFKMIDNYDDENIYLNLEEGYFESLQLPHRNYISGELAYTTSQLLKILQPVELEQIKLNKEIRRKLLMQYLFYYALHINDFGQMKTLTVLEEVL